MGRLFRLTTSDDGWLIAERMAPMLEQYGGTTLWARWESFGPHLNVPRGVMIVAGYEEGLSPTLRFHEFLLALNRNLRQARPDPTLLTLLGVERIWSDLPIDEQAYPPVPSEVIVGRLYSNPAYRGEAFWESDLENVAIDRLDGQFLLTGEPMRERAGRAVELGVLGGANAALFPLSVVRVTPQHVRVIAEEAPDEAAVLALGWFPGWEFEDGAPVEWLNAVHAKLPARTSLGGKAVWELHYRPEAHRVGSFLTLLGLAVWFALFAWWTQAGSWSRPPMPPSI